MKPAAFDYHAPRSLDEALAQPSVLVDLNAVPDLAYIRSEAGGLRLGGMTRQRAIERSDVVARGSRHAAALVHARFRPRTSSRASFQPRSSLASC